MDTTMIILLFLNLGVSLFSIFWKSYFSEKGKNLATKKDVGIITKEIETVKSEISRNVLMKSEFEKERKEIALSFFDTVYYFVDYTTQVNRLGNNPDNLDIIQSYIEDVRFQSAKVFSAYSKVLIYFDIKGQIVETAGELYNSTIKFQHLVNELLFQLEPLAQKKAMMIDFLKNGDIRYKDELFNNTKKASLIITNYIADVSQLKEETYQNRSKYITSLTQLIKL